MLPTALSWLRVNLHTNRSDQYMQHFGMTRMSCRTYAATTGTMLTTSPKLSCLPQRFTLPDFPELYCSGICCMYCVCITIAITITITSVITITITVTMTNNIMLASLLFSSNIMSLHCTVQQGGGREGGTDWLRVEVFLSGISDTVDI